MLSEQLRIALKALIREMRRDADIYDSGISLLQGMLLATVGKHTGISVGDLARMQNVRSPTISGQIKILATAGLLERSTPQVRDRRRSGLQLTQSGHELLHRVRTQHRDWLSQRIARLTPEQMDALDAAIEPLEIISRS